MQILLISDIHANFPALKAIETHFEDWEFDYIVNCGDSLVYGPFPNETLSWMVENSVITILGNTDKKVIKLLKGNTFKKPSHPQKRIMYTWTANQLSRLSAKYLRSLKKRDQVLLKLKNQKKTVTYRLGIYHGSPAKNHEFLFSSTPESRFFELASIAKVDIAVFGHSHDPFHKYLNNTHFINPGSCGRMFDGNPRASCATLSINSKTVNVQHHRISYDIQKTTDAIRQASLPEIYCKMYRLGKKMN